LYANAFNAANGVRRRAGEPPIRVSVFGNGDNWSAALLVSQVGNADRKARFQSIVSDLRREFGLKP
jgi:hypothetical protein